MWIYETLNNVSRSFSFVIKELNVELRDTVAVFYLILRALDTIEDDMLLDTDKKEELLEHFYEQFEDSSFVSHTICGYGFEKQLMMEFDKVLNAFYTLPIEHQKIIVDATKQMGAGMSYCIDKNGIISLEDYNEYCYYVAGLVGIGLSKMFVVSSIEHSIANCDNLSVNMGIFLQKTNIIRDYLEDVNDGRIFWPKEIWGKYAKSILDFKYSSKSTQESQINAICCLNEMILDALSHFQFCLQYISKLQNQNTIVFCSIPQIMALATLELCYNNYEVFMRELKIKREESGKILIDIKDGGMKSVVFYIRRYLKKMQLKVNINNSTIIDDCLNTVSFLFPLVII